MGVHALLLLAWVSAAALPATPRSHVFLLIDPLVLADPAPPGWEVYVNQPVKEQANPLLREDKVWDVRWDNAYPTARYDPATRTYRLWHNAFIGGEKAHPSWSFPPPVKPWPTYATGLMYAESNDGVNWTKPELGAVQYPWNGTSEVPLNNTNLVLMTHANTDCGVMYDAHETNASRRYKALGTFYSRESATSGLCRGKGSKTPKIASDGTFWPPCHNLGVAYSADGIRFDHAEDEDSFDPGNAPGLDTVGQNDGAEDLAIYDEDLVLEGASSAGGYWGLVRLDVVITPCNYTCGPRPDNIGTSN